MAIISLSGLVRWLMCPCRGMGQVRCQCAQVRLEVVVCWWYRTEVRGRTFFHWGPGQESRDTAVRITVTNPNPNPKPLVQNLGTHPVHMGGVPTQLCEAEDNQCLRWSNDHKEPLLMVLDNVYQHRFSPVLGSVQDVAAQGSCQECRWERFCLNAKLLC